MFGEWVLYTIRGGKFNRHCRIQATACGEEAIDKKLKEIEKVRDRRGYREIESDKPH